MKKLLTVVFAMLLGASLSFAQAGGTGDKGAADKGASTDTAKKGKKGGAKGKKGGKKSKKSSGGTTTPAPK